MNLQKFPPMNFFSNMHVRTCAAWRVYALTWQLFPDTGVPYVVIDVVTSHQHSTEKRSMV